MNKQVKVLIKKAEELDWNVTKEDESVFRFSKYSPAGQDFSFSVDTENDPDLFLHNLNEYHSDFDCSQEAYLWIDDSGHGCNGAPYDMKDLYEDMEACRDMISDLFNELHDYYYHEVYNEITR